MNLGLIHVSLFYFSDDLFRFRGCLKKQPQRLVLDRFAEGDAVKAVAPQQPRFLFLNGFGNAVFDLCQVEIGVLEVVPRE